MSNFKLLTSLIAVSLVLMLTCSSSMAMDEQQAKEFNRILTMKMQELTAASFELLSQKYPDEDWEQYDFPAFVFTSESVEAGYKIAVKEPEILGEANVSGKEQVIPCYCFCDAMGHKNLLYCFWKDGMPDGEYDDHAASCNICYGQAMLAFLWSDLGATHDEIIAGMEKKFSRLLKMHEEGKH